MSAYHAANFSQPATRRRALALLCVVVVHVGVFYWVASARFFDEYRTGVQRNEIELKFSIVAPRPERQAAIRQLPPAVALRTRRGNSVAPVSMMRQEAVVPPQASETPAGITLDLDQVKQSAVAIALAEMKSKAAPEKQAGEQDNAIGKAINQASRPKCDNDYKPKVAGVALDGLMKLPFLVGSALSDTGCKW